MCLNNPGEKLLATEDITVYKRLEIAYSEDIHKILLSKINHGDEFSTIICRKLVTGKITIKKFRIYFCTNSKEHNGDTCKDKQGYDYSWTFDCNVSIKHLEINGAPLDIEYFYQTPYQHFPVELGKTYYSELGVNQFEGSIEEGIHSYSDINDALSSSDHNEIVVTCTVPKGSYYYVGRFSCRPSIASDTIIYSNIFVSGIDRW